MTPFKLLRTELSDLVILQPSVFQDHRGQFVKTFHADFFRALGLDFTPTEEFYSVSAQNVLRGMHFQLPPAAHAKLVYCLSGAVLDVVLDLRDRSPTFGRAFSRELTPSQPELLFIPVGFAHGFLALEDSSRMVYLTDQVHAPAADAGVRWNSFGFQWPVAEPIISERDRALPSLCELATPF